MPKPLRLNREQLLAKYADPEVRRRILELLDLRSFLLHCIIASNYKISDELNSTVVLSNYGDDTLRDLVKKGAGAPDIPPKEARLICFLEFSHLDLLVDPLQMDPERLAAAIGKEITDGRIHHPFIHGPELYLKAAKLFQDERSYLSVSDTRRLIDGTSFGVFQMGRWICGPYGITKARTKRAVQPTLRIPLQHCHDVSCHRVHEVQLSTDATAPINQYRPEAVKVLDAQNEEGSEFPAFFSDLAKNPGQSYSDVHPGTIPYLVGGGFSDDELKLLLVGLLDNTKGVVRADLAPFGKIGRSADWVRNLTRSQLLQQILHADDSAIAQEIDALVFADKIVVPSCEVRYPPMYSRRVFGAYGVRAEVSTLGFRIAGHPNLGPLRLRRLVNSIFRTGEIDSAKITDSEELDWQLRGVSGITLATRLDEYLRTASPDEVVRRLILTRRENVTSAMNALAISANGGVDDNILVQRILWKLGFEPARSTSLDDQFRDKQANFEQSVRSAAVSSIVDREAIRAVASNYFVALEELLLDTLSFATWILTSDHVATAHPFEYDPETDGPPALQILEAFDKERGGGDHVPLTFSDKTTLHPLCSGFRVLAELLESKRADVDAHRRPNSDIPEFNTATDLQDFPFLHGALFLDLTAESQAKVLETLKEVSRTLLDANVPSERNEQLHFRQTQGDLEKLLHAVGGVRSGIALLEGAGFTRHLFYPDRCESDRWGRSTYYFTDHASQEVALGRPSAHEWANLPSLGDPQYLVSSARFAEPQEFVRVTLTARSQFAELWRDFPQRRQASGREKELGYETLEASGQRAPQTTPG